MSITAIESTQQFTRGPLLKRFGVQAWQFDHAVSRYGPEPAIRLGNFRVWVADQLPDIEAALRRTVKGFGCND